MAFPTSRARRGDRGAGALEYIAMLAVFGTLVAGVAVLPIAEPARLGVQQAICNFLGQQGCGGQGDEPLALPKCEITAEGRKIGASVTLFSVKLGRSDSYDLTQYGDGSATVMTGDVGEIGVEGGVGGGSKIDIADDGTMSGGAKLTGSVSASGGLRLYYDFADGDDAQDWVDDNRNIFAQTLNFAGGPLADGAEQLWNELDDGRASPTAIAYEVSLQAQAGGQAGYGGVAEVSGGLQASGTGVVRTSLVDGTSVFTLTGKAGGDGQATLAMAAGSAEGSASSGYTVTFDAEGNPVSLQLRTTTTYEAAVGMNTGPLGSAGEGAISGGGWDFDISEWGGENRTTQILDLTDPANRAAFDDAFVVAGPTALVRPDSLLNGAASALGDRIAADALQVTGSYAVDNNGVGIDLNGSAGLKFGIDVGTDGFDRRLLQSDFYDPGDPGAGWQPLTTC